MVPPTVRGDRVNDDQYYFEVDDKWDVLKAAGVVVFWATIVTVNYLLQGG